MLHDGWRPLSGSFIRPSTKPLQCNYGTHPLTCLESALIQVSKVDEAHERSVYTDLLLAILKKSVASPYLTCLNTNAVHRVCRKRPSLRVIVSSATLDATAFLEFFSSPPDPISSIIVSLEGRAYPVHMAYLEEPTEDYVRKAAETVISIHRQVSSAPFLVYEIIPTQLSMAKETSWSF